MISTDSLPVLRASLRHKPRLNTERTLLLVAGLFLFTNTLALAVNRPILLPSDWLHLLVWIACAVVGTWSLDRWLPRRDPLLFPLALLMTGWGLILIDRLAPVFAERQTLWLIVSMAAMLAVVTVKPVLRWLRTYRYVLLLGGLLLLVATIVLGTNPSGQEGAPELWLGLGPLYFQPSEALKIMLVAFLASYLGEQYPSLRAEGLETEPRRLSLSPRIFGPIVLMWGLSIVFLIWQRDLGTAILFFVVFLILLYVASGYTPLLLIGAVMIVLVGIAAYRLFDVVQLRIDVWLNPWPEANGRAYQIVQSLMAFASGGVIGQGVGQGSPIYIPVVHSDFVFAALAEEWGLLGVVVTIACIATFVMRGLRAAVAHRGRPFHSLFAIGLSLLLGVQSLLIMAGVLKLIPLTGVTLPYFSYGGSSLLMNFISVGLLLRLSSEEN
jgi:cell division protein FtsW (lipid II flippase)